MAAGEPRRDERVGAGQPCQWNRRFQDQTRSETITKVVSNFELTGGQISNIKKKLLLKSIVDGVVDKEAEFFQLCKEELSLESNKSKSIGY